MAGLEAHRDAEAQRWRWHDAQHKEDSKRLEELLHIVKGIERAQSKYVGNGGGIGVGVVGDSLRINVALPKRVGKWITSALLVVAGALAGAGLGGEVDLGGIVRALGGGG